MNNKYNEIADIGVGAGIALWGMCYPTLAVSASCGDPAHCPGSLMSRKIELVFAALFALFFIFWLTFDLPVALGLVNESAGWYAREVEPIYLHPPSWLSSFVWFPFVMAPSIC